MAPLRLLRLTLLITLLLVALAPAPALAQDHEHSGAKAHLVVVHDVTPEGYAVVGNLAHFGFLLVGPDGLPARHHDARLTLEQNGVLLFDSDALHDYDGIASFGYTFTVPGPYVVTATVPSDAETLVATFNGTAVLRDLVPATLVLDAPAATTVGALTTFTYQLADANGTLLPHTDAILELRRVLDDTLLLRVHTHTHEEPMAVQFAFPDPGTYQVRLVGYNAFPTEDAPQFETVALTQLIEVTPGLPLAAPALAEAPVRTQHAGEGHYKLFTTYDPQALVGPFNAMRTAVTLYDAEVNKTQQHVNFEATIRGPAGNVLFASKTLHEYDGILELVTGFGVPGEYTMAVSAQYRNFSEATTAKWTVLPPVLPLGAGAFDVTLLNAEGLEAGVPANLEFFLANAAGVPFEHSEVDFQVVRVTDGPILAQTKLHTHTDGKMAFTVTFPEAGDYLIRVDAFPTGQSASAAYTANGVGKARYLTVTVADGPGLPALLPTDPVAPEDDGTLTVPALGLPLVLAVLVGLAAVRRFR
ncbi:MAG TPA: hypothetical protein VNZ52_08485 [Candidatus Thermoplasmatota archaeon]|nr:hypothetical protein [Candidatus Thermoplasmatota archaeon]